MHWYEPAVLVHPVRADPHVDAVAHSFTSVHVPPLAGAVYPAAHAHTYEPAVFVQPVRAEPHVDAVAHSFTSTHAPPIAVKPLGHEHV